MHQVAILDTAIIHQGAILDKARIHRGAILVVQSSFSWGAILALDNIRWSDVINKVSGRGLGSNPATAFTLFCSPLAIPRYKQADENLAVHVSWGQLHQIHNVLEDTKNVLSTIVLLV